MALIGTAVVFKRERKNVSQSNDRMPITGTAAGAWSRVFAVAGGKASRKKVELWARSLRLRTERA
jgi:hypothetical protein